MRGRRYFMAGLLGSLVGGLSASAEAATPVPEERDGLLEPVQYYPPPPPPRYYPPPPRYRPRRCWIERQRVWVRDRFGRVHPRYVERQVCR